jgi:hypothetical protein
MYCLQVLAFLDQVAAARASQAQLLNNESLAEDVRHALTDAQSACISANTPTAKAIVKLMGVTRLMLHTDAVDTAVGLLLDMCPLVTEALEVTSAPADGVTRAASSTCSTQQLAMDATSAADVQAPAQQRVMDTSGAADDRESVEPGWINRLTECLLGVLADSVGGVPISVVRSSAEGVWRTVTQHVNAMALLDLLRVVTRMDRQDVEDDLFEEEDEDDEASVSEDSDLSASADGASPEQGDSGDEDSGSEDEGSDQGKEGPLRLAGHPAERQTSEEQQSEPSSTEEGDADDEEMFRMDEQLAKYFTSIKKSKKVCTCLLCNRNGICSP